MFGANEIIARLETNIGTQRSPREATEALIAIGRLPGWLAHWKEAHEKETKIGRPRQIYTGATERKYVPLDQRT